MRIAKQLTMIAASIAAAMILASGAAHAESVTRTVCIEGNGRVVENPTFPHLCVGGRYDGAEVWS
ncbi:hypothetical protein [Nocardia sp. alder85J]|uniref:hypothetical protein n=1 Tax=Nocardia sp. alder85J TaxID=2862949 RepID=UPI001CD1D268|nr:hypothetical protein [Nocardia sp. alder85J]MCX4093828.1 hypothetical protein [Nocardia sp. alder85J]